MKKRPQYRGPGTLCPCGAEPKNAWQIVGDKCFAKLPLELKSRVAAAHRKSATADDRSATRTEVLAWLKANP